MILKLLNTPTDINLLTQYLCEVDKDFRLSTFIPNRI